MAFPRLFGRLERRTPGKRKEGEITACMLSNGNMSLRRRGHMCAYLLHVCSKGGLHNVQIRLRSGQALGREIESGIWKSYSGGSIHTRLGCSKKADRESVQQRQGKEAGSNVEVKKQGGEDGSVSEKVMRRIGLGALWD